MAQATGDGGRDAKGMVLAAEKAACIWEHLLPKCSVDISAKTFLLNLEARGLSNNTIIAYGRSLESFIEFAGDLSKIKLDILLVYRFLGKLRKTASRHPGAKGGLLSQATIGQRLVALRAYADYLVDSQILQVNPVPRGQVRWTAEGVPVPIRRGLIPSIGNLPKLPTDEQWRRLLDVLSKRGVRDQLMLTLAYDAALRRNELVTIQLGNLDFSARELTIMAENSKGGRERRLIYSETTSALLKSYLHNRRLLSSSSPNLFISISPRNRGQAVTGYTWGALVSRL